MMLQFRTFEIDDIKEIAGRAVDEDVVNATQEELLKYAEYNKMAGPAFTGLINGRVICAAGLHLRKGKSGHLWSVFTKSVEIHKKNVFRSIKMMFDIVVKTNGLRKVITESRVNFPQSQRLLQHLGFKKQRRSFSNDYHFYRKVI